jgi:hypothetical protein
MFCSYQCFGSGSVGSISSWATGIRIRVRGTDLDSDLDTSIICSKNKLLISAVLWLLYDFLSVKNDVNVALKKETSKTFCWHLEGHWWKEHDPERGPDPLVRGTDLRIWIRSKMSRIRNTGSYLGEGPYNKICSTHLQMRDPTKICSAHPREGAQYQILSVKFFPPDRW